MTMTMTNNDGTPKKRGDLTNYDNDWDFEVRKVPLINPYTNEKSKYYLIVRDDNDDILNVSGKNYNVRQNSEINKFAENLKSELHMDSIDSYVARGGKVFMVHIYNTQSVSDVRYDMVVIASHDRSNLFHVRMVPYVIETGAKLMACRPMKPPTSVKIVSDDYHKVVTDTAKIFKDMCRTFYTDAELQSILKTLFPLAFQGISITSTEYNKSVARQCNRVDLVSKVLSEDKTSKFYKTFYHIFSLIQEYHQLEWSRIGNPSEEIYSNVLGSVRVKTELVYKIVRQAMATRATITGGK